MNRFDLTATTMEQLKFTKDFIEETDCNECAEAELYSPKRSHDLDGDAEDSLEL